MSTVTDTILANGLGRHKSVACVTNQNDPKDKPI